jgi:hypothetical protein
VRIQDVLSAAGTDKEDVRSNVSRTTPSPSIPQLDLSAAAWTARAPLTLLSHTPTERRFKFRGMPQAVGAARRALREWEAYFEPDLFYDISLCVSELVTQSVQRAEPGAMDEAELSVRRDAELVCAEVLEPRQGVAVTQPPTMGDPDWGMFIIDRVADRWGVDRSVGTRMWWEIDVVGEHGPPGSPAQRRRLTPNLGFVQSLA